MLTTGVNTSFITLVIKNILNSLLEVSDCDILTHHDSRIMTYHDCENYHDCHILQTFSTNKQAFVHKILSLHYFIGS